MHTIKNNAGVLCISIAWLLLAGCARTIHEGDFPATIIPEKNYHDLNTGTGKNPVHVLYIGCGHMIIQYKNECIVIDPFFSTQGLTSKKIYTYPEAFKKYESVLAAHQVDLHKTSSVWLAHTHYDHMSDLPALLESGMIPQQTKIYGSNFGDTILTHFLQPTQYHSLSKSETYDPANPTQVNPIPASPSISILPIRSSHAPHYKLLGIIPIHMMKGNIREGYFKTHFKQSTDTTRRKQWKEGCTYSYLVDFMDGDSIEYRLFIQTSASHYPLGRPPAGMISERGVDAAFLCVASSNYVKKNYPIKILEDLQPKKIVWIHWEDFFSKPIEFKDARMVRLTSFKGLNRRLSKTKFKPNPLDHVMPRPGTMITIH